jgi:hypothetical protein
VKTSLKGYKQGVDENIELKSMLDTAMREVFELVGSERSDAYPYNYDDAASELEYYSRDGFIAASHNLGGIRLQVFETIAMIMGSGRMPASKHAAKAIRDGDQTNHELACEEFKIKPEEYTDQPEDIREKITDAAYEAGHEDTIMFEVCVMYHGMNNGIHSATVQTVVNTEYPYHRSRISWAPGIKCEDYIETEITWRSHARGKDKIIKAAKAGINKLF